MATKAVQSPIQFDTMKQSLSKSMFKHIDAIDHQSVMIMLTLEGGICIYSKELLLQSTKDPQLISGALTAIANLTTEILSFEDPINKITINDLSIFITRVNNVIIYYIFKGDEEESIDLLVNFILRLNKHKYWRTMAENTSGITKRVYKSIDRIASELFS
ncbi:MAG: hypothetical protein ACXAD7_16300 [Candidatus Kariarchaeaceae archaeon]|jgi:hypothetical protein